MGRRSRGSSPRFGPGRSIGVTERNGGRWTGVGYNIFRVSLTRRRAMDAKTQQQYAETFHGLHRKGDPLILFNVWDVATAKAIAKTSPAVATSSAAVGSALGYADEENVPLDMVTGLVSRMTTAVSVPVSSPQGGGERTECAA